MAKQTAIVITLPDHSQVLVRAHGVHLDPDVITVDDRSSVGVRWYPVKTFEVRLEGKDDAQADVVA